MTSIVCAPWELEAKVRELEALHERGFRVMSVVATTYKRPMRDEGLVCVEVMAFVERVEATAQ